MIQKQTLRIIQVTLIAILGCTVANGQETKKESHKYAFLVGVNHYTKNGFRDLKYAESDVIETGKELKRIGFDEVVVLTSTTENELYASRANIEKQLDLLLRKVGKSDVVMIMLSGHGQQLSVNSQDQKGQGDSFFCPADAVMNKSESLISISWLTDTKLYANAGKKILIVDACRDTGIVDNDKGIGSKGIEGRKVALPEGVSILFSCSANQKSYENDQLKHGVFAYSVLEVLRKFDDSSNTLTWKSLVSQVLEQVSGQNVEQEPLEAGTIGHLVLATGSKGSALSLNPPTEVKPVAPIPIPEPFIVPINEIDEPVQRSWLMRIVNTILSGIRKLPTWVIAILVFIVTPIVVYLAIALSQHRKVSGEREYAKGRM